VSPVPDEARLRELASAEAQHIGGFRRNAERFEGGGVTELLLIRHGLTNPREWRDDPPLNDLGQEQAQVLAEYLATRKKLGAVVASPFLRCRMTAEAIAGRQGLEVEFDDDLHEIESYVPEGQTLREILGDDEWEAMQRLVMTDRRWDARGKWFESGASIRGRAVAAVDAAIARYPEQRIAMVTHGPVINAYLATITQSAFDMVTTTSLTGVSTVWARGETRTVRSMNSTAHFGTV
jgi:probable phosphoglycerate mutase